MAPGLAVWGSPLRRDGSPEPGFCPHSISSKARPALGFNLPLISHLLGPFYLFCVRLVDNIQEPT